MPVVGRDAPPSLLDRPPTPLIDWAAGELATRGVEITAVPAEFRRRPWSLLVRLSTTAGPMWAKANARPHAHDGPLMASIARLVPGAVPEPVAVHADRGWVLTADGGPTHDGGDGWCEVLGSYAELQHRLSRHVEVLRAAGAPWLPPPALLGVYRRFESRMPGLAVPIARAARALAGYGRLTIEHNDLRPANVFATGALFDWGDAVLTHPSLSALPHADPAREAYLDRWARLGAPLSLREITLGRSLAPLVALHPWTDVETRSPRHEAVIAELVDAVRAAFS